MTQESPTTKYFSAAVHQILARDGHGAQADLARRARISPGYLGDLLAGRRPYWPDPIKERIAQVCGYSVAELLEIGRYYIEEGAFWPHGREVKDHAARSVERMAIIIQLAAKDVGIGMEKTLFTAQTVGVMLPGLVEQYQNGSLSDAKLYHNVVPFLAQICGK